MSLILFAARNCISLEDFLEQVALPSLVIVRNDGKYVEFIEFVLRIVLHQFWPESSIQLRMEILLP